MSKEKPKTGASKWPKYTASCTTTIDSTFLKSMRLAFKRTKFKAPLKKGESK